MFRHRILSTACRSGQ